LNDRSAVQQIESVEGCIQRVCGCCVPGAVPMFPVVQDSKRPGGPFDLDGGCVVREGVQYFRILLASLEPKPRHVFRWLADELALPEVDSPRYLPQVAPQGEAVAGIVPGKLVYDGTRSGEDPAAVSQRPFLGRLQVPVYGLEAVEP